MKLPRLRRNERIVFPVVRVDDRLLHGQVVVGWGQALSLSPMILASDRVAKDSTQAKMYKDIIPAEQEGNVLPLVDVAERWQNGDFKGRRAMVVLETPVDALKLVHLGVPMRVLTLGGLHYREDRVEVLPYIYLSEWDRTTLLELRQLGVKIVCQDLPSARPIPFEG